MKGNHKMNEIRKQAGLVQRCIIVQRDENGYGLTVSGDNPVFVQSVKDGSAAAKAGVQVNDQIIKVNGKLVAQSNHLEVVSLIKSGSFVALTLLGKDTSASPNSSARTGHTRQRSFGSSIASLITGSSPSSPPADSSSSSSSTKQDGKVNELQRILASEHDVYKKHLEEYMRHPTAKAQQELADSQTRITSLEQQLKALTGSAPPRPSSAHSSSSAFKPPQSTAQQSTTWSRTPPPQSQSPALVTSSSFSTASSIPPEQPLRASSPPVANANIKSSSSSLTSHEVGNVRSPKITKISNSSSSSSISSNSANNNTSAMNDVKNFSPCPVVPDDPDGFPYASPPMSQPIADIDSAIQESSSFDALFAKATKDNLSSTMMPMSTGGASVISYEEDEFNSEDERFDDHGPFIDLDTLRERPAHLAVFLHFLMSNNNPVPLLFWLVTDVYSQESGSSKEMRRWAYEIYSTFIGSNAPLKVQVSELEELSIEESFSPKSSEDRIKSIFDISRLRIFSEVNEQLADFRNKRALGLGGLFGDHQLEDNLDRSKELKVIDQTLLPHLDALMNDSNSSSEQNDRNCAMAAALTTFLKQVGLSKLERCHSFVEKEKGSFIGGFSKKKIYKINGHQFNSMNYNTITLCNFCDKLLWGIAPQGYQCQTCDYNVHKHPCSETLPDMCTGRKVRQKTIKNAPPVPGKPEKVLGTSQDKEKDTENGDSKFDKLNETQEQPNADSSDDQDKEADRSQPSVGDDSFNLNLPVKSKTMGYKEIKQKKTPTKNVGRSESVKTVKDNNKNAKGSRATLPGIGKTDFGVYGASPYKQHGERPESTPPPDSDEDDESDSDLEVETENPNWQSTVVDKKILSKLKSKELKRQEVIHELIHTERTHVRNLKVLYRIFYKPLLKENILPQETLKIIFPNLEELIEIHESLLVPMKELVKQSEVIEAVGELMLTRFDGAKGLQVKEACATFCRSQKRALLQLKKFTISKLKVQQFMTRQESHEYCRRLKFTDIMATTHQRLVKYPLLLDQINKSTPVKHSDFSNVELSSKCCRDILNHVNNEIKIDDDIHRLEELSKLIEDKRVLDKDSGEEKFEITKHTMITEGGLTWKVNPQKMLNLHVVLLDDLLVLLQVNDNGKFILKNHHITMVGSTGDNKGHSPLIKLTNIIIREVATDKTAFFVVSTSMTGPQIYELVAQTRTEKFKWTTQLNKAAELMKAKDTDRGRRGGLVAATSIASPLEERRSITKQSLSLDESAIIDSNLPSAERLAELQNELISTDEELKKVLERRANIIAEMRGGDQNSDSNVNNEKSNGRPKQPRDIVLAAIAQTNALTEGVNMLLVSTKETSTTEQRKGVIGATVTIQEHLTALLNSLQSGNEQKSPKDSANVKRSKSLDKPERSKSKLKNESSSSTSGVVEPVISHSRSHSSPAHVLDMNAVGMAPVVSVRQESIDNSFVNGPTQLSKVENLDSEEKIETSEDSASTPPEPASPPPPQQDDESNLLMQSPFKMLKKRTSEPTMMNNSLLSHLQQQQQLNSLEVKPVNRASSFSGFSHNPNETGD